MTVSINLDNKCLTTIWYALTHLSSPKPRIEELETSINRLEARANDVKCDINEVERNGQIRSHEIAQWLRDVGDLKFKAAKAKEDFGRRRSRCLDGWSWNCFSVNRRVDKMLKDSDKLMNTSKSVSAVRTPLPPPVVEIPTSNCINSTPAMETYRHEILGYIDSPNANAAEVIGIYGMGGVGKTTLLTNINNHLYDLWSNSEDQGSVLGFDYVIYVVVSKDWTMKNLQMDIAKRVGLPLEDDSVKNRRTKLFNFLNNKNCLLFLDDQWESLELIDLGIVSGKREQQKRKVVVFTTRDERVCLEMTATRKIEIKCLEPEQALDLFRRNVGEDIINSDAGINQLAEQIAKECGGLPLALVTVGKAMQTKRTYEEWGEALTLIKQSQMLKVTGEMEADRMFSVLRSSYDSLKGNTRGCLLSCALWPENHSITIDELIECWMGLGLIKKVDMIHAYNEGHTHVETLKAACLLKPGDNEQSTVKMHDVIRDMVLWMASSCGMNMFNWIVRVRGVASQALEEEAWHEAKRVSLMYNNIISLPSQLSTCSELSVLMLQHDELEEVRGSVIQTMRALTYLDLEESGIREIPKEIGQLTELLHLNLSYNPIRELPVELGGLTKLTYLLLRDTSDLTTIATGAISKLSSLKLLDLRGSKYNDCGDELQRFTGCHKYIGINITTKAGLQRLSSLQHVLTWQLCVERLMDSTNLNQLLDDIIRSRNISQSLQRLRIENIGMNELRNTGASKLGYLKYLHLSQLCLLEEIKWEGLQPRILFPHLRELSIDKCNKLRNVNWALQLTVLQGLEISNCETMEEIISEEGNSGSEFIITKMKLSCMSKLKGISSRPLNYPFLEELQVLDCPLLRTLPFANERSSRNRLKVIQCQQTWWDNWEEVNIKDSLLPLVQISL